MPGSSLDKVRSHALELPEADRAELAHDLVSSLDGVKDEHAVEAWDKEISRRIAEVDSHTGSLIDRQELTRRMRARMGR